MNFTHSLTTDIFNFSPNDKAEDGQILTNGIMVNYFINPFNFLINNDEEVFSKLFSNPQNFFIAGEKHEDTATAHKKKLDDQHPRSTKKFGYQNVTVEHCRKFVLDMKKRIGAADKISAFGR